MKRYLPLAVLIPKLLPPAYPRFFLLLITETYGNFFSISVASSSFAEVNKDRHDFLLDAVKTLYDQCKVEIEKTDVAYSAKLVKMILGFPKEEIEEAKNKMEDSQQMYDKMVENYLTSKQKEIEDAYQHYLEVQAAKRAEADEKNAAHGQNAGQQLRFDSEE